MDESEVPKGTGDRSTQPLCLRCGMNPRDKSFCAEPGCDGNGGFLSEDFAHSIPPATCAACNNRPWEWRQPSDDPHLPYVCDTCGLSETIYRPRPSEVHYLEFVDCAGCYGTGHFHIESGNSPMCPACEGKQKMHPDDNLRLYRLICEHLQTTVPLADTPTMPRGHMMTLTEALGQFPYGVVNIASSHYRLYVEPHRSRISGQLVDDTIYIPQRRHYDVLMQTKRTAIGVSERIYLLHNGELEGVCNALSHPLNCSADDILIDADWRGAKKGGTA